MIGAQASNEQLEKILSYFDLGRQEGAEVLTGGSGNEMPGDLARGYYVKPTVLKGHNEMRIFQEEILGPVVSVTTFKDDDKALSIANDTLYGLGAGIWNRDANRLYRFGRAIQAGAFGPTAIILSCTRGVWRIQAIGHRPRNSQDDARPLPADEEHAGQLQPQEARLLLILPRLAGAGSFARVGHFSPSRILGRQGSRCVIPEAALAMLACARIGATHSIVFGGFSPDALADASRDAIQC
jgi:hypothetical protein